MIRIPQWRQIAMGLRASLARIVLTIKGWWSDARREPERRTNVLFLAGSLTLTAVSPSALSFGWQAYSTGEGPMDARPYLTLAFTCNEGASDAGR